MLSGLNVISQGGLVFQILPVFFTPKSQFFLRKHKSWQLSQYGFKRVITAFAKSQSGSFDVV